MSQPVEQGFFPLQFEKVLVQFKTVIVLFPISNSSHVTSVYCFYLPCREVKEQVLLERDVPK